jgi:hypothetical protein
LLHTLQIREFLNNQIPQRWIRGVTDDDRILLTWPPLSPNATPCDFFVWGYVKDQVYVPPLPAGIPELKVRIRTAIRTITADIIQTLSLLLDRALRRIALITNQQMHLHKISHYNT